MKLRLAMLLLLAISAPTMAERYTSNGHGNNNGGNTDVVVDLPPEVWTQGSGNSQPPCQRCCIYENRSYTEGAVLKSEGVLLQCARDEQSLGTNNLIWRIVK
ncbi:YnjH family protein [Erwinia sp. AnSW2-5]|uniref:YnjH family protein n=1 Tax=Erwinia sp. AnSW2-5 TaxID=3367692 RepID=UPI00385A692B